MNVPSRHFSTAYLFAALCFPLAASASPGFSPNITVDTRGSGNLTVTGRVLNGQNNLPLAGALITLAGQNTTSAANGTFSLANVSLAGGSTLNASAAGFVSQTRTVVAAAGQNAVNVGDISLAGSTDKPVVESVKPDVDGIFLAGFGLIPMVKARVNWNGNTPGNVVFRVNGSVYATLSGAGPEYSVAMPVDSALRASLSVTGNVIAVTATAQEAGKVSASSELRMAVVPLPAALLSGNKFLEGLNLKAQFSFPNTKPAGAFNLPVLSSMSAETSVAGEFSYNFQSGAWNVEVGKKFDGDSTKYSAFKLKLGPLDKMQAEIKGRASGTATPSGGINFSSLEIIGALSLSGKFPLGSYSPFGLLGPGLTAKVVETPVLGEVFQAASVILWVKPALGGQLAMRAHPAFGFKDFTMTGKTALEAAYEPKLGSVKAKFYVGGEPSVKFGLPGEFFREMRFQAYAGVEASVWVLKTDLRYVFVNVSYPAGAPSAAPAPSPMFAEGIQVLAAADNLDGGWQVMPRPWRAEGGEVFLPHSDQSEQISGGNAPAQANDSGLEAFVRMGQGNEGAEAEGADTIAAMMIMPDDGGGPAQAEFPLLENVFPNSEPALAGHGNQLMLLYLRDTGADHPVQFTEVAFSYFDGTTWTAPASITSDARGQFSPQVVFDGAGNAVAVFERIKDAAFAGTDLQEMAAQMEIIWSRWDSVTKTWSAPQALTDNASLDFSPQLGGPLTDGDLLLTWNQSESNEIDGTGAPGAETNLRVMTRRWDTATQAWGTAAVLVPNLTGELSQSLAARGEKGVYAWSVDMDGDTEDSSDAELFYRLYNATTGEWGPITRHTNDAVKDNHVHAVVDAAGNVYAVWNRNGDLVMDVNFNGTPSVVREGNEELGVADFALTIGPGGNVAVIWQEMTEHGSDAHYRVYDPASGTWGKDGFLSQDSDLERSFAPVWDAAGNLTLTYNNVKITKETVSVEVEGGEVIEVEGVPQPGRVDLMLAKRALVKDLALAPDGISATGTDFLPDDAVTLFARVKNVGNLAVANLEVAFYDGDPADGGTLIGTAVIPGWLEAMDEAEVSLPWTVPQPAQARTIFVVVDPDDAVTEVDETNNQLALPINGVDLALEYQSGSVLRDGSVRVVVKVRNLSAPDAPVSALRLKAQDSGETLAEVQVSQLAPGQSVDIAVDLPAGTQGLGDRVYLLTIDEEELIEDIDRENNEALFALNLPLDENGGFTFSEIVALDMILKRFAVGDAVDIDLSFLSTTGTEKLVMLGLPKGLVLDPNAKRITGTVLGLLGETPIEIRVLDGNQILRAALFALSVSPHPYQGAFTALLESADPEPLPTGMLKLLVTSTGTYSATLNQAGQSRRAVKGSFTLNTEASEQTLDITFPAGRNNSPPTTTLRVILPSVGDSDLVTGQRDGGTQTLRGFRLARPRRTPLVTQKFTLAMTNSVPGDGVNAPAGTGTLTGVVDAKGMVRIAGFTGDAQTLTASFDLAQTNQAVFWMQPYKNKASYLGGILTLGNLGLPDRAGTAESLTDGLKWYKAADATEKVYPAGFDTQMLEALASRWVAPATAVAMAESLGLAFGEMGVSYGNPLAVASLPSRFRLSTKLGLLRIAPNGAVPWKGKALTAGGTFAGTLTLPNGAGRVNGVFLQDAAFGGTVGAGLIRVPLPASQGTPKGSFQTIGIDLAANGAANLADGSSGFTEAEEAALEAILKRFFVGDVVDIDLGFLSTAVAEKLAVLGLPKGLAFNATTKRITGTVLALLGETPVEIRVLNGSQIVRASLFNLSVSPYLFLGSYAALVETTDATPMPAGQFKMAITAPGVCTATLHLAGQARRNLKGAFVRVAGAEQQLIELNFPTTSNFPATTIAVTLSAAGISDLIDGQRDGGSQTLRGFRLAKAGRTPVATQKVTMALVNATLGDGINVPAGTGTLSGTVDGKGLVKLAGFTGDAQAFTGAFTLTQTNQVVFWVQPYKNKASYLGGIATLGDLGLADRAATAESLTESLIWLKVADAAEKSYPAGFDAQTLEARASRWFTPSNAGALAESLGLAFHEIGVGYLNPLGAAGLPSRFRLSEKFALIRIAPNSAVPWNGMAAKTTGIFSGSVMLPTGVGRVSGVLLQDAAFDESVGAGLVRVPLPAGLGTSKGSFQTIGVDLQK